MTEPAAPFADARHPLLRVVPEPRLAAALALAGVLWLVPGDVGRWLAVGALAALTIVAIVDVLRLPGGGDVTVARSAADTIGVGDENNIVYSVSSAWNAPLTVVLDDDVARGLEGGVLHVTRDVPARGTIEITAPLVGQARGRHPFGAVGMRVRTRLGLVARRMRWQTNDSVLVAPSVAGVRRFRLLALQHRLHDVGIRTLRRRGDGRTLAGLREYVVGDDPRLIDWKASARRGKPITREFTVEQAQSIMLLIDAGRSMTQTAGTRSRFEHALAASLVLADVAATAGDRVGALVFDDEVRAFMPVQRGAGALRALRALLVPVQASLTEPDYSAAFRFLAMRQRRRALVVFFTDVVDARSSRALITHVARGSVRHLVLVVALRNDDVFARADTPGTSEVALYERAASEELIQARESAIARMRHAGATVVDVSPREMTAAVVNRYLEIKSRGAL